jgi:hypothetical protein
MRILLCLIICVAVLLVGDMLFFKSRYSNQVWRDMQYEGRKFEYEIRRLIKFLTPLRYNDDSDGGRIAA